LSISFFIDAVPPPRRPAQARPSQGSTAIAAKKTAKSAKPDPAQQARAAATLLKHVSDATRLTVISLLAGREHYVGELAAEIGIDQPALSHHLALLRAAGVIEARRQAKQNFYRLTEKGELLARTVAPMLAA
jgi:DNA-binding transcriptional ArsR family regulator